LLGINADGLLAEMNAMTVFTSDRNARNYLEHYYDPSGRIKRPVLSLHTTGDALATPNHESAYRVTVDQEGNGNLLVQQFVTGGAHCTFTSAQDMTAIDAMMYWLDTRQRPGISFFPASLGFSASYSPLPWPW
jgi:hypothetical protein